MSVEPVTLRGSAVTREALAASGGAALVSALLFWTAPPGVDLAAHLYQRAVFLQHGFDLWNNFWYAGRYSFITYSLIYYPLAAVIGIKLLAVATIAAAALVFAVVVLRQWGAEARWSTRSFAVVWAGIVLTAAFPFALGIALALLAIWALQDRRLWRFALFAVLTVAASPVAFLLLALVLLGLAISRRTEKRTLIGAGIAVGTLVLLELALWRVFPDDGRYPFSIWELLGAYVFCGFGIVLTWRIEGLRLLRTLFPVYAVACTVAFIVPSAVGDNVLRVRYVAFPIAMLLVAMRQWRPRLLVISALVLALSWNVSPLAGSIVATSGDPSASAAFWAPAIRYLHGHLTPSYRVEAVDTGGHWPAYYLPLAGIPLVRGWFRQEDFPQNALLYGKFGPRTYMHWLRSLGVEYVVLANAPPDYSAEAERDLLRSGRLSLQIVYLDRNLTVYEVPSARAIVTGPAPARVVAMRESSMSVWVAAPGVYRIAVRYSSYWHAESACLSAGADKMMRLVAIHPGLVKMTFDVTAGKVLTEMAGGKPTACS